MKRLAVLTLTAAVGWGASGARASDPLPLPTGFAPTSPQVPAPSVRGGAVVPVAAAAPPAAGAVQLAGFRPGAAVTDWARGSKAWCTDCAPAVRHPLPPVPDGAMRGAACAGGACGTAAGGHDGHCWNHFKEWLCFGNTPVHLGYTPTPRITPFYTYFLCAEKAGCAAGNCGPGSCAPGHPRLGGLHGAARGCTTCPTPGEAVMPGFRLAAPTTNAPAPVAAPAPAAEVVPSGFRIPASPQAAVPYRQTGATAPAGR